MRKPNGTAVVVFSAAFALLLGTAFADEPASPRPIRPRLRPAIEHAATSCKYVTAGRRGSNNAAQVTEEGDVLRQPGTSSALAPQPAIAAQSSRTVSGLASSGPTLLPPTKTWTGSMWQVVLNWLGGTLPYTVATALNATFDNGVKTVADAVTATTATVTVNTTAVLNCFDVSDASTLNEATQGMGYTPQPAPTLPVPDVQSPWWGGTVEFVASYLDPIAQANTAFFFDLPARGTQTDGGSPPSWVQFTIPDDARSFYPVVQAHGRSSGLNGPAFVPLWAPIPTFSNIRGVTWAPQTGKVWVAADALIQEVDLFREDVQLSTTNKVTTLTKPYISRVTTGGMMLCVDGTPGVSEVLAVNVTNTGQLVPTHFASTKDSGFTRNITPVGIAVDPDGSACYIADSSTGKVVMIPANAGGTGGPIVDQWGGRMFTFPDPCGIDVNIGHQVMIADDSTGYIYQITEYASTPSHTGSGVHSIQVDQDCSTANYIRYESSNDPGFTEAFNLKPLVSGDANSQRYHGADVFGTSDGHLQLDYDKAIYATMRGFSRVVINNSGQTQTYPSTAQVGDRIVAVTVVGWPNIQMQLRVIDPPDLSAYAPDAGWPSGNVPRPTPTATPTPTPTPVPPYEANDNVGPASDFGLATGPNASSWTPTLNVIPTNADGSITVYLKVAAQYSGDNYQIEITKCKADGTVLPQRVAGLSGVYTSWKRVFVERDKMFRRGGLLFADAAAHDTFITLYKNADDTRWDNLNAGDKIAIFDTVTPYEGPHDEAYVGTITQVGSSAPHQMLVTLVTASGGNTPYQLNHAYTHSPVDPTTNFPTFAPPTPPAGTCAGVGVTYSTVPDPVTGQTITDTGTNQLNGPGSAFYDGDMRGVELPLDDGFVEYVGLRPGSGAISYISASWFETIYGSPDQSPIWKLARCWFANFPGSPHSISYLQLIGAGVFSAGSGAYRYGLTLESNAFSYSFRGSMEAAGATLGLTPSQVDALSQHNVVHELVGHQFWTNICNSGNAYHDTRNAWCNENKPPAVNPNNCGPGSTMPKTCVMEPTTTLASHPELYDGVNRFCLEDLYFGDPTCSPSNPNTAIRTHQDPI